MRRHRSATPFLVTPHRLDPAGFAVGTRVTAAGEVPVAVKNVSPGATVEVVATRKKRGVLHTRILSRPVPPPDAVDPPCPLFRTCGGCLLQDLPPLAQRRLREELALSSLGDLSGVQVHPIRSHGVELGYRNKVELTYGPRKFLSSEELRSGVPRAGRYLGFHPAGRFDPVVDVPYCHLIPEGLNRVLAAARQALATSAFEPWDAREHHGFWRHLLLREAGTGQRLAGIYTTPAPSEAAADEVRALAAHLAQQSCRVLWYTSDRVADAVVGEVQEVVCGEPFIEERLTPAHGPQELQFRVSPTAFFQSSAAGAACLYDTVARAIDGGEHLLDLYCGIGTMSCWLAHRFQTVVGVESNGSAVADARRNATLNGLTHVSFHEGEVERLLAPDPTVEAAERPLLDPLRTDTLVVDPPRVGLHPRVTAWLARHPARTLIYVACHPPSLGRDRVPLEAEGWRMDAVWPVDLFPQTPHVEVVARFRRDPVRAR